MSRFMRPFRVSYTEEIVGVWLEKEFTVSGKVDREGQILEFKVWFRGVEVTELMRDEEIRALKVVLLEEADIRIEGRKENKRGAV